MIGVVGGEMCCGVEFECGGVGECVGKDYCVGGIFGFVDVVGVVGECVDLWVVVECDCEVE